MRLDNFGAYAGDNADTKATKAQFSMTLKGMWQMKKNVHNAK